MGYGSGVRSSQCNWHTSLSGTAGADGRFHLYLTLTQPRGPLPLSLLPSNSLAGVAGMLEGHGPLCHRVYSTVSAIWWEVLVPPRVFDLPQPLPSSTHHTRDPMVPLLPTS